MVREPTGGTEQARARRKGVIRLSAAWIVMPLFFFVTGGSLLWWQAWVYCALLLVPMTFFVIWMARRDPSFFDRRFKMRENDPAQRRIQAWATPLFLVFFIVPGLDYRFGWSNPPHAIVVTALILSLGAYLMVLRVFLENRWAGRTVETWQDQKVVNTGPYAIVRHPMYTAVIALMLTTPIALGSYWGIIGVLFYFPVFVFRTRNEERLLLHELSGYEDYRARVRYRIIPFIW
jgi:protein-S-isoprenylcysteine O-methyltransferase Ste14